MSVRLSPCQRYSRVVVSPLRHGLKTASRCTLSPLSFRQMRTAPWSSANPLAVKGGSEELWLQAERNRAPASINDRRQKDKRAETTPSLKLFTATQSYLTASFSALPETNAGTLAAAILISLPVCGLRPVRSALWFTLKVPKPTSCTASPSFRDSVIAARVDSRAALAWVLDSSAFSAITSIS